MKIFFLVVALLIGFSSSEAVCDEPHSLEVLDHERQNEKPFSYWKDTSVSIAEKSFYTVFYVPAYITQSLVEGTIQESQKVLSWIFGPPLRLLGRFSPNAIK